MWNGDYGQPVSLNRWVYGAANPARFTDPSGYMPWRPPGQLTACWKDTPGIWKTTVGHLTFSSLLADFIYGPYTVRVRDDEGHWPPEHETIETWWDAQQAYAIDQQL